MVLATLQKTRQRRREQNQTLTTAGAAPEMVPWAKAAEGPALNARLYAEHRIEVPFTGYDERCFVRISGQVYNRPEQYTKLAEVLRTWR